MQHQFGRFVVGASTPLIRCSWKLVKYYPDDYKSTKKAPLDQLCQDFFLEMSLWISEAVNLTRRQGCHSVGVRISNHG